MQWVFVTDDGQNFDLDAQPEGEHASADRFEYLMPDASRGGQLSGAFVVEGKKEEKPDSTQAISYKKAYATLWHKIEDRSLFISAVFEYLLRGDLVELPEGAVRYVVAMYGLEPQIKKKALDGMSCKTPWGYEIEDGDSVLAYEQRADATFVCNIQRRTCQNGKLSGKFVQKSCDEGKKGNIQTLPFLTLNDETSFNEELQGNVYQQERERKYLENK